MFQPSANLSASNIQSSMRLPKLQLPNFDGYTLKWPEFWDIYESSMHRQDIPNVMKFRTVRGSAALAITGISVTNENYDVAIRILRERFGNKEYYMPSCNICQRLQIDLVILNIVIEKLLRQLESQGEVVNQQRMLVHQLLSKFPLEARRYKKCDQVWTIDLLRRLLNQYIAVRENAQRRVNNARGNIFQRNNFQGRQTNRSHMNPDATGNQSSVETFAANVERKRIAPRNPCIFCKGDHFNDECESFKSLTERKQKLLTQGRCFLCFKAGHTFKDCPSIQRYSCHYCGKRGHHNWAVCPQKFGG